MQNYATEKQLNYHLHLDQFFHRKILLHSLDPFYRQHYLDFEAYLLIKLQHGFVIKRLLKESQIFRYVLENLLSRLDSVWDGFSLGS
jgi:hypothetical protein